MCLNSPETPSKLFLTHVVPDPCLQHKSQVCVGINDLPGKIRCQENELGDSFPSAFQEYPSSFADKKGLVAHGRSVTSEQELCCGLFFVSVPQVCAHDSSTNTSSFKMFFKLLFPWLVI